MQSITDFCRAHSRESGHNIIRRMINRVLIRSKVLQMAYAYRMSEEKSLASTEKEFVRSLEKSHELYHYLLQLIISITDYAEERIEMGRNKYLPTEEERNPNTRFIDNRFVIQLRANKDLEKALNASHLSWDGHEGLIKTLFEQISGSPFYIAYMEAPECDYEADRELWRKIFKQVIFQGSELEEALEESSIYWNDDIDIVSSFVTKTIRQFDPEKGALQPLLPMYKDEEDRTFAINLLRAALLHGDTYREMITAAIRNWELDRLALMDLLIMQIALAEIIEIPDIPVSVSLNEYIDLAKIFSTEKSCTFINGTLDHIVQDLRKENKLFKN